MAIPTKEEVEQNEEDNTFSRLQLLAQQRHAMEEFWRRSQEQIEASAGNHEHILPIDCVKNVIRPKNDAMMLSADTPTFVTKLCELFVQELTLRAWVCANSHNRDIILGTDIAEAITTTESYHFLGNVLRSHKALGSTAPDIDTSARKHIKLDQMTSLYHPTQEMQASRLAGYPPHVPIYPPIGQMGTQHKLSPFTFMMQGESLLNMKREKSLVNEVMVCTNKMSINNFDGATSIGGGSSSDVAIVVQQGETTHPFSSQNACPSLEDNYVVPMPTGHVQSFSPPTNINVKKLHQEEKNIYSQDVAEEDMSNESLEGSQKDEDLFLHEK
ncbi:uncharacterized protein [Oryza sativa Japonica Group]|uniref:Os05g0304800 protein n=4 Tax=Oryza TaxID=4527 RepID=A0A8J8YGK8_ORYSJ|nr:uncharacterized protein LOC4338359 [Oryza sativa Japonica Group]AIE76499.1 nuclear factor Y transcription factor [Oryza sativa]AIR95990.1 hypothetical protein [Oryza sativa Japonica Group]EEE63171.1 hypothetical protein OsJ_17980 [Oryza sativa Japonica Group]KAF2930092.1 hypothetical protein DAI22_05g106900 [Oryza sativa Japonica Group]BAF17058.1 Os05g0304800 [Oryza sativa Japonica Group]|eukprot:NP_001055144.1 Os05g0304800 [Oryza sativa Japonica Group]